MKKLLLFLFTLFSVFGLAQAKEVIDVLTVSKFTAITAKTTYTSFDYTSESGAIYNINCAESSNGAIQLRSTNNSGIVVKESIGTIKSIEVTWEATSAINRQLNFYSQATSYSTPEALYASGIIAAGNVKYSGTSNPTNTYTYPKPVPYAGLRSNGSALYLSEIKIYWEVEDQEGGLESADLKFGEPAITTTLSKNYQGQTVTKATNADVKYTSSNTNVAVVEAETGKVEIKAIGVATITATAEENDKYKSGTAQYTITVGPEENQVLNVEEAINAIKNGYTSKAQVKGIISTIDEISLDYGNATYDIVDEGSNNPLKVYRGLWKNGVKFTEQDQIEVGGTITVEGDLLYYNNVTPEIANNNVVIEYIAPSNSEPKELGEIECILSDGQSLTNGGTITVTEGTTFTFTATHATKIDLIAANDDDASVDGNRLVWTPKVCENNEIVLEATLEIEGQEKQTKDFEFTLTVTEKQIAEGAFVLVTSLDQLGDDAEVIIVNSESKYALSTNQKTSNRGAVAVQLNEDNTIIPGEEVAIIEAQKVSDGYTLYVTNGDSQGYLYASSGSSNQLKTRNSNSDNNSVAAIVIAEKTTITFTGSNTRNALKYNYNNGDPLFSCYGSGQTDILLYMKSGSSPIVKSPGLYFDQEVVSKKFVVDGTFTQEVVNDNNVSPIVYSSSSLDVATVNAETGEVTFVGIGETVISAAFAGDDEFNEQTVSYTLELFDPSIKEVTFDFKNETYGLERKSGNASDGYIEEGTEIMDNDNLFKITFGGTRSSNTPWRLFTDGLRVYSNPTNACLTFTAPKGVDITQILWTAKNGIDFSIEPDGDAIEEWTGTSNVVTLYVSTSSNLAIEDITILYSAPDPEEGSLTVKLNGEEYGEGDENGLDKSKSHTISFETAHDSHRVWWKFERKNGVTEAGKMRAAVETEGYNEYDGTPINITASGTLTYFATDATASVATEPQAITFELDDNGIAIPDLLINGESMEGESMTRNPIEKEVVCTFAIDGDETVWFRFNPEIPYGDEASETQKALTEWHQYTGAFRIGRAGKLEYYAKTPSGLESETQTFEFLVNEDPVTGVTGIEIDMTADDCEIYDMMGRRVAAENLAKGLYIVRQGGKTMKVMVK